MIDTITDDDSAELETTLRKLSESYYNGESTVSDEDFDSMVEKLKILDPNSAFLKEIGTPVASSVWPKRLHKSQMLSLSKCNTKEEFLHWAKDKGDHFFLTEKADGSTVVASYKDGKLVAITTRGDGSEGEDITSNGIQLKNVKQDLGVPFTGEIRGEALMRLSTYKNIFEPLGYRNARNGATGKLRDQKESGLLKHLEVMWFDVIPSDRSFIKTENDKVFLLESFGLSTIIGRNVISSESVWSVFEQYVNSGRTALDYEIDGLVVKVDSLALQGEFGVVGGRPKGAIAIKFPSVGKETTLLDVHWQRGKTGRFTPVAVLAPVNVCGVTIVNASLHNMDQIGKLGISIGDKVIVQRNNDVIPQVVKRVGPGEASRAIEAPKTCFVCETQLVLDGAYLTCCNEDCGGNVFGKLMTWIEEVKVMQLGPAHVQNLINFGITTPLKLYEAHDYDFIQALNSEKLGLKAFNNVQATKVLTLDLFLSALNIPSLGTTNGKRIAQYFKTIPNVLSATKEDLEKVPGIKTNAVKIRKGLKDNKEFIESLSKVLTIKEPDASITSGRFFGKSFCITGVLSKSRGEVEDFIRKQGGEVKTGVSKGLSYLITDDPNSGSSKNIKADKHGVSKITEMELYKIANYQV